MRMSVVLLAGLGLQFNGIVVPLHGQTQAPPVVLTPDITIGKMDGPDQYMFGSLWEIAEDAQGFIYTLDPLYRRIQVYDATGKYRSTIGAKGWGPGEFQMPESFALTGEYVVVRDFRKARYLVLDSSGKLVESLAAQVAGTARRNLRTDTLGHLFDLREYPTDPGRPRLAVFDLRHPGASADTIRFPLVSLDTMVLRGRGEAQGFGAEIPQPFMAEFLWTVLPDGTVVYAHGATYTLTVLRPNRSRQTIRRPVVAVPIPSVDRREELERLEAFIRNSAETGGVDPKPYLDRLKMPDHFPPVLWLDSDPNGRIWVRVPHPSGIKQYRFEVLDREGRLLGRVDISADLHLEPRRWLFGRNRIYAVARLEYDVDALVGFPLPAHLGREAQSVESPRNR